MDTKAARQRIRKEWAEETREDRHQEEQIEFRVKKWKRATIYLGVAFGTACASVVPLLAGHAFHRLWDSAGKNVLVLTMIPFSVFVYVCAHYLIFWNYLNNVRKINQKFAPPHIKYNKSLLSIKDLKHD